MVPYTIELGEDYWYEVGRRYHGWALNAKFLNKHDADQWCDVMNSRSIIVFQGDNDG